MTVIRPLLRLAAVSALKDQTWAETRVFDSDNTPLQDAITAERQPYIVVYTDDDDRTEIQGRDIIGAKRGINLIIEFGIANAIDATEGGPSYRIPDTDQGMELALDLLESQIINGLNHNPHSTWGEHFRNIADQIAQVQSKRGGSAEAGTRWAARQLVLTINPIFDAVPGVVWDSDHPVSKFIDAINAGTDDDMKAAVKLIASAMSSTPVPGEWRQAQATLAHTEAEIRGIGVAPPLVGAPEIEAEPDLVGVGFHPPDEFYHEPDIPDLVGDAEPEEKRVLPQWPPIENPNEL